MQIVLTGKNGLGFELQRATAPLGELVAVGREHCDLSNLERLRSLPRQVCPQIIVNSAVYTDVDRDESAPSTAMAINATVPLVLEQIFQK